MIEKELFIYYMLRKMDNCIFCKINAWEIPSYTLYEDNFIRAILDINPCNEGHILVIPQAHFANIFDIEGEYLSKIIICVKKLCKLLQDTYGYTDINIVQSTWAVAGQEIYHFHFHIMPRKKWDNVVFTYKTDIEAKNQLLKSFTNLVTDYNKSK